ncbi:killer cell lectin-like receptor subfamily B member 1B allele C isoform X2 [Ambystoma mexicanum]|uniref:killer cell lectin-like receptor subfamily B member 1B allele C isoform X2 n=1 Tax=Ambystoma mexicanum TaxID=8296 RepID=UPI0037E99F36
MNQPEGTPIPGHSPTHGGANPRRKKGSLQRDSGGNSPGRLRENLSTAGPLQSGSGDPGPPRAPLSPEARRTINTKPGCPPSPQRRSVAENQEERHLLATKSADNENEEGKRQRTFPNVGSLKVIISPPEVPTSPCAEVTPPCLEACPMDWLHNGRKCYHFSEEEAEWEDSQIFCASYNASLALIDTQEELDFMLELICTKHMWVGLRHNGTQFHWVNGTACNSTVCAITDEGECVYMGSKALQMSGCSPLRPFICTKKPHI